jgi:hypothetical protein
MTHTIRRTIDPNETVLFDFVGRTDFNDAVASEDIVLTVDGEQWDRAPASALPNACVLADGGTHIAPSDRIAQEDSSDG